MRTHYSYGITSMGAAHFRNDTPCQDAHKIVQVEVGDVPVTVIAVADGHGGRAYDRSDVGARIAVECAAELLHDMHATHDGSMPFLDALRQFFAQRLIDGWRHRVRAHATLFDAHMDDVPATLRRYGTTLLFALIADHTCYVGQIGDGDILIIDADNGVHRPIPDSMGLLGSETYSLISREQHKLWGFAQHTLDDTALVFLSTDGLSNSYADDEQFAVFPRSLFKFLANTGDIQGRDDALHDIADRLWETSSSGSGDDMTIAFTFVSYVS